MVTEYEALGSYDPPPPPSLLVQAPNSATEVVLAINAVAFNMFVMRNVSSVNWNCGLGTYCGTYCETLGTDRRTLFCFSLIEYIREIVGYEPPASRCAKSPLSRWERARVRVNANYNPRYESIADWNCRRNRSSLAVRAVAGTPA